MVESTVVAEWIAQGKVEGRIAEKRADLLRLLHLRFSEPVAAEVVPTIEAQTDREILSGWFDAAVTAPSWEEFRATVGI